MAGLDAVQTGFDSVLGVLPILLMILVMVMVALRFFGPVVDEQFAARSKARALVEAEQQRKVIARAEIVLRGEFDEWLDAEVLRLQIDCLADPNDTSLVNSLTAVTQARASNAERIAELHQGAGKAPALEDTETLKKQWQSLRARGAAAQA